VLGLDTVADPTGVISAGVDIVRPVQICEHDRRVSFFLSWVTPTPDRLRLEIEASDGGIITASHAGVRAHQGNTYTLLTVEPELLRKAGKVGPSPWKLKIIPAGLDAGEKEKYQYSVIVDSALKMSASLRRASYKTGNTITMSAKVTEGGHGMTGLTQVYVNIARPRDGLGNWFAAHKFSLNDDRVPRRIGEEPLSPLQSKARFLIDVRKLALPGRLKPQRVRLYDDGARSHGDAVAGDGVYSNRFTKTGKEGSYGFHFHAGGATSNGNRFHRDEVIEKYVTVGVAPKHVLVKVIPLVTLDGGAKRFRILVTPKDALGNYLGPKYAKRIVMDASRSKLLDQPHDHLDGTYSQVLEVPPKLDLKQVDVTISIEGRKLSFNLAEKLNSGSARSAPKKGK
jgi:hypothetical protein